MIPVWAIALIVVTGVGVTMITVSVTVNAPDSSEVIMECSGLFDFTAYTNTPLTIPWNTRVEIPCSTGIETIDRLNYTVAICSKTGDTYVLDRGDDPCKHNTSLGCDILTLKSNEYAHYTKKQDGTRVVHIYCNDGYTISGTSAATCVTVANVSMTWDPPNIEQTSSCMAFSCPPITNITGGTISDTTLVTGEYASITCNTDFYLSDQSLNKVYCKAIFNSSRAALTTAPTCKPFQCPKPVVTIANTKPFNNPVNINGYASISCSDGYAMEPSTANRDMICSAGFVNATVAVNLTYSSISFVCAPGNCTALTITNSDTNNVTLALNQAKTPSCDLGYELTPRVSVNCQAAQDSATPVNSASPTCIKTQCPSLGTVTNGKWNNGTIAIPLSDLNTIASMVCNSGFKIAPTGAVTNATCTAVHNSASIWFPAFPTSPLTCVAV